MSKIRYGSIVPLIGGITLGMQRIFGSNPEFLLSYPQFMKNERHLQHHMPDVPYFDLTVPYWEDYVGQEWAGSPGSYGEKVDVVSTTCPCAGLSVTSSQTKNHGAHSSHNEWMYTTAEYVLGKLRPKVFFGENAPALFGMKGEPVAARLAAIGKKYGYAYSMVFTDTQFHGVPQRRPRTFYFFWGTPALRAPKFKQIERPSPSVADFMRQVKYPVISAVDKLEFAPRPLTEDLFYLYAVELYGESWRAEVEGRSVIEHLKRFPNGLEKFVQWAELHASDHPRFEQVKRIKEQMRESRGHWDDSPKVITKLVPAIMFKNTQRIVHPYEERFLNVRELMSLMGFPTNFSIWLDPSSDPASQLKAGMAHISQNVPVNTAADMASYIQDVLQRRIPLSDSDYYMYDNTKGLRLIRAVPDMEEAEDYDE